MFAFGSTSSLIAGKHDPAKARSDPGRPTPVRFPRLNPDNQKEQKSWTTPAEAPDLFRQFTRVRRPVDITPDFFTSLNVKIENVKGVADILSALPADATSYLPPESWKDLEAGPDAPQDDQPPKRLLANGREYPGRDEFTLRLKEILNDNYHAFSALTRTPDPNKKPPRLAHFRKFWEGLDNMAYYWDSSRDEFNEPPDVGLGKYFTMVDEADAAAAAAAVATASSKEKENAQPPDANGPAAEDDAGHTNNSEPRKKAKTQDASSETDAPKPNEGAQSIKPAAAKRDAPSKEVPAQSEVNHNLPPKSINQAWKYKGMRIGSGRGMPESYRVDTVRGFLEPLSWQYGLALGQHRRPPALQIQKLRVPVRVSSAVWKSSVDRVKAKSGIVQGPVAGIRCADFVEFAQNTDTVQGQREALMDAIREIGSILCIAQERAREGKKERRPGEGQWWTTVPRWGGGPGGDVGEGRGDNDGPPEKAKVEKEERSSTRGAAAASRRAAAKKKSAAEAWAELKPGIGYWDPKVEYEAVGKDRTSEWDDVFSFSCLNHHVALLHLHVHPAYLEFLQTGELPSPAPRDPEWCRPVLRRSRWYDFFGVADRVELFCGLWGLFGWLVRTQPEPPPPQQQQQQDGDGDVEMKDAA